MAVVEILTGDDQDNKYIYALKAMIDSGSPINLIKHSIVSDNLRSPVDAKVSQFCGINGSRLEITGVLGGDLKISDSPK